MSLLKISLAALLVACANGTPVYPSKVIRDDDPKPSPFPLGEACGNEYQYLNFDPENDTDKKRLQKLHDVICMGELRALSSRGAEAATEVQDQGNLVYDVFFADDEEDEDENTPGSVHSVLMIIAGASSTEGMIGKAVGKMVVDNKDFGGPDNSCDNEETLAYTQVDENGDKLEKIHFCDSAYDRPTAGPDVDCNSLDKYPSTKMDTFSRIVLHETLHYSTVGPESDLGDMIVDQKNDDDEYAYGPERAHGLNAEDQDNQPGKAENNADNYAWMSITGWVGYICTNDPEKPWDEYFPDDPPKYSA